MGRAGRVAALLCIGSVGLAVADRDQVRKGRRPVAVSPSALVATDDVELAHKTGNPPDFTAVDTAQKAVAGALTDTAVKIKDAHKKATAAMTGAVEWKVVSSEIPKAIHEVHEKTHDNIWMNLQHIAPMVGGAEKESMATLLKAVVEDVKKQKTDGDAAIHQNAEKIMEIVTGLQTSAAKNHAGEVTAEDGTGATKKAESNEEPNEELVQDTTPKPDDSTVDKGRTENMLANIGKNARLELQADSSTVKTQYQPTQNQKEVVSALIDAAKTPHGQEVLSALAEAVDNSKQNGEDPGKLLSQAIATEQLPGQQAASEPQQ